MQLVEHPSCGKTFVQRGNRTGHCPACHQTFEGITLYDAHRIFLPDGSRGCVDVTSSAWLDKDVRLVPHPDGYAASWRGPEWDAAAVFKNGDD